MIKNEIIYEIFLNNFYAIDKKNGQINGITEKLNYLKELGITQIWITPFYVTNFEDSGYDIIDYYNVDKKFGTNEDFKKLIKEAKKHNIKIMIDLVLNHCSDQNEWFKKAINGEKKYQDFFIFREPKNNKEPNNWKSKFGGSAWKYVEKINKYYLHLFSVNQPDFNWENEIFKNEVLKILNYWIELGVKGFRLDVCNLYSKTPGLPDDTTDYGGRNLYTNGPKMNEYLKFLNKNTFGKEKDFLTVGEMLTTEKEIVIEYVKPENHELDVIFDFHHMKSDFEGKIKWIYKKPDLQEFKEKITELQEFYQANNCLTSLFINNHDQPRSVSRFGNDKEFWYESATSMAVYIFLQRGIPFIYQGEEIGMTNFNFKNNNFFFDVETKNNVEIFRNKNLSENEIFKIINQKARDHSRTVMQWDDSKNAGFTNNETSILVNDNYKKINVQKQIYEKDSILNLYKLIFNLRKNNISFSNGTIEFIDKESKLFAYKRKFEKEEFLIISNLYEEELKNDLDFNLNDFEIIFNNYKTFGYKNFKKYQSLILKRKNL